MTESRARSKTSSQRTPSPKALSEGPKFLRMVRLPTFIPSSSVQTPARASSLNLCTVPVIGFPQTQDQQQKYAKFLSTHHAGSYLILNLTKSKYNYSAFNDQGDSNQPMHMCSWNANCWYRYSDRGLETTLFTCHIGHVVYGMSPRGWLVEGWTRGSIAHERLLYRSVRMLVQEEKHVVVFHANSRHEGRLNMVVSCVLTYLGVWVGVHAFI